MAQTPGQIMQAKKVADVLGVTVPDKITSGDLKGTPTTPTVTPTSVDTTTPGVLGAVESSMDQFTKMAQENKKNAQQASDTSRTAYTDRLQTTPTESELTATQYETQGVNTAQKELDDINSQLQVEQNALRREMERIQDNKTGASMGQVQNMVNEAESKSLRKQADLAVIQMGLQGKFNTAKAIADRAVDASMEREKNILEALKINYEDNKALFTSAEQREFDTLLSDRERKYNEELADKKAISDYSIEAMKMGAGSDIINAIRGAKTPEDAQAIAAGFMGPRIDQERNLDMQAKLAQIEASRQSVLSSQQNNVIDRAKLGDQAALKQLGINVDPSTKVKLDTEKAAAIQKEMVGNDAYKAVRKGQDSLLALTAYEEAFNKYGLTGAYSPIANKELESKYQAALLNLKEFFNLGVLNGPDLSVIQGVIPPPTNQGLVYNPFQYSGSKSGIENMKKQIGDTLDDRYLSLKAQYGNYDDSNIGAVRDLDRIYLQNKAQIDPGVAQFIKENPDMSIDEKLQVINSKL